MLVAAERARVKWACRRGMLELDVLVMPFFEECFDDPDLFKWMMQHGRSDNTAHAMMVDKIVAHNNSKLR